MPYGITQHCLANPSEQSSELKLDTLRNIQPMELGVMQMCQATVELVSSTDDPNCSIYHTLKTITGGLCRLGQHGIVPANNLLLRSKFLIKLAMIIQRIAVYVANMTVSTRT